MLKEEAGSLPDRNVAMKEHRFLYTAHYIHVCACCISGQDVESGCNKTTASAEIAERDPLV